MTPLVEESAKNTKARCWPMKAKKISLLTRQMFRQYLFLIKTLPKKINFHLSYALSIDNCLKLNETTKYLI